MTVHVAYDDRLLKWQLGDGHPSDPRRAKNALDMLETMGVDLDVRRIGPTTRVRSELERVHSASYVDRTLRGINSEWAGERPDLAKTAALMFQGTVDLVGMIDSAPDSTGVYFSPQGAKHHAMYDWGSGFCVFADFAWAALHWAKQGERVLVLDTDAHHGDGTEALTYGNTDVMTCSIHDSTIFPGTGHTDAPKFNVWNWALPAQSGDGTLWNSVDEALELARAFEPTRILVAVGGDGHERDPLSSLTYTYEGYRAIGQLVGTFGVEMGAPVLVGGAGGYRPDDATPQSWATFVAAVEEVYTGVLV